MNSEDLLNAEIKSKSLLSPRATLCVIFSLGILFTAFVFFNSLFSSQKLAQQYFERAALLRVELLRDQITLILNEFNSLSRFFENSEDISPDEFAQVASSYWQDPTGIEAILWESPQGRAVSPGGSAHFLVQPDSLKGRLTLQALEEDLKLREFLRSSFETVGQVRSLDINSFLGERGQYLVLTKSSLSKFSKDTVAKDQESLGQLILVVNINKLMKLALAQDLPRGLSVGLYDTSQAPMLQMGSLGEDGPGSNWLSSFYPKGSEFISRSITLPDRKLLILIKGDPLYLKAFFMPLYWLFWPFGICLTVFLVLYVRRIQTQKQWLDAHAAQQQTTLHSTERRLLTTLRSIGDGLITTDSAGFITQMNPVAENLTEWSEKEALGKHLAEVFKIITEDDRATVQNPVEIVLAEGRAVGLSNHTLLISRSGRECPIADSGAPIIDESGKVLGVVLVFRDVTEERLNSKALWESEKKFRSFFLNMNEGVALHKIIYGKNGVPINYVITDVNPMYEVILGVSRKDVIGRLSTEVYHVDAPLYLEEFSRVAETGVSQVLEIYFAPLNKHFYVSIISFAPSIFATVFQDVTVQKKADAALLEVKDRAQSYLDIAAVILLVLDNTGKVVKVNKKASAIFGYSEADMIGQNWFSSFLPEDVKTKTEAFFLEAMSGRSNIPEYYENVVLTKDGQKRLIAWHNAVLHGPNGELSGTLSSGEDITDRKLVEESLASERNLLRTMIDNLPDSIYVKDPQGRKLLANRADLDFIGVKDEKDVLGKTDADLYSPLLADQYSRDDQVVIRTGRPIINREEIVEGSSGIRRWLLTSKLPLKDLQGNIQGLIGIGRDITDRKLLESKLLNMAHYDALTALPNRTLFFEKAKIGIARAKREKSQCAILFIDLDHFKSVNDTMGHTLGDDLLKDSAVRIAECIRETDTMARLGGDEFIIFLSHVEQGEQAKQIAERIREKLNAPRMVSGHDLFITASIGIAVFPGDGEDLEDLLKNADTAMYAAKESGRNTYCFFDNLMNQKAVSKMQIDRGLRNALMLKEFALFYQPIINVTTGKIRGFEALIRWFRTEGGLVFPDEFIPVAEETGLIVPIGEWILKEACQFNRSLIDAGHGNHIISVNLSVVQLRKHSIIDVIRTALQEANLPPELLEIEVTESVLIESFDVALEILNKIREMKVLISLDDFGTGYSSLSHLQRLPIAILKIDRLFIKEITMQGREDSLIPAIIDLAHKLNLSVVAEGVETDAQLEILARHKCDYYQGYFFSRPMPQDKVLEFIANLGKS